MIHLPHIPVFGEYTNTSMYSYKREVKDNSIIVDVALPGVAKEDVKAEYRSYSQSLCIFVKDKEEQEIPLYREVDSDKITAKLDLGILKITLPLRQTDKKIAIE